MGRKQFSPDYAFSTPSYRNLIELIAEFSNIYYKDNKKIKFKHLRYYLCENHGNLKIDKTLEQNLTDIMVPTDYEKAVIELFINDYIKRYEKGELEKSHLDYILDIHNDKFLTLITFNSIDEKYKFKNEKDMSYALSKLIFAGLIEKKPDIKGYDYYELTFFGKRKFKIFSLIKKIDFCIEKCPHLIDEIDSLIDQEIGGIWRDLHFLKK